MRAPVHRILPQSLVDGPGNRSVIFLQGCNFRCQYCHNPETMGVCRHCGACVPFCATGALGLAGGRLHWQAERCTGCGECHAHCPSSASPKARQMSAEEVMEDLCTYLPFIRGITVSGGECSLYPEFLRALFHLARQAGLSTLLDSNGSRPLSQDKELLAYCDGVMIDIKAIDPAFHLALTQSPNTNVLKNARELAEMGKLAEIRTVILPGSIHNEETVRGAAQLLGPYARQVHYKLLRFRPAGTRGEAALWQSPTAIEMETLRALAQQNGFSSVQVV